MPDLQGVPLAPLPRGYRGHVYGIKSISEPYTTLCIDLKAPTSPCSTGRVDDVINVSGHRIGTAEVESALASHPACAEAAVVGYDHPIKGQGIYAYVTLMDSMENGTMMDSIEVGPHGPVHGA